MELLVQRIVDGLANGSIYSLVALAIVLIFTSTGTLNLAQGAMGMFATFVTWWVWDPEGGMGLPLLVAVVVGIVAGALLGALAERLVMRPVEDSADHTPAIIVTLGLMLLIQSLAQYLFTTETVQLPSIFPEGSITILGASVKYADLGLIAATVVVGLLLYLLFERTRTGLSMRATVDNPESSRLVGIRRTTMLMLGWLLAGALGALAGILIAPTTLVSPTMLDSPLFLGFAAAALGGFSSAVGAVIGGLVMGLIEALAPAYIPFIDNNLASTTVFVVMVLVLLVAPHGIFGRATADRV